MPSRRLSRESCLSREVIWYAGLCMPGGTNVPPVVYYYTKDALCVEFLEDNDVELIVVRHESETGGQFVSRVQSVVDWMMVGK